MPVRAPARPAPARAPKAARPGPLERLAEAVRRLSAGGRYRRGDLVRWRHGCADEQLPRGREPAVVVEHREDGIVLLIAVGADGGGVPVWTEGWRLEPLSARQCGQTLH